MKSLKDLCWRTLERKPFQRFRPWLFRSNVFMLEGNIEDASFQIVIQASDQILDYFSNLYANAPDKKFFGRRTQNSILASKYSSDLLVVQTTKNSITESMNQDFFLLPRINFLLNIEDSIEIIKNRFSESKKRGIEKASKIGLTIESTQDPKKIDFFYNSIYLPHISERYGKNAFPVGYNEVNRLSLEGTLSLVKLQEECVGGSILMVKGDELYVPIIAAKSSTLFPLTSCMQYLSFITEGKKRGCRQLNVGDSHPFINDGLFQYKKSYGMQIRQSPDENAQTFAIRFLKMSKGVITFLRHNPFVFIADNELCGLLFYQPGHDYTSVRNIQGLSKLYFISENSDLENIPAEFIQTNSIKSKSLQSFSSLANRSGYCLLEAAV